MTTAPTLDEIATTASRLRVPMTHVPRDAEYLPVLAYRVQQEIEAAELRATRLRDLARDVERYQLDSERCQICNEPCGERDLAEMYDPSAQLEESFLVHAECGIGAGWNVA